MATAFEDRQAKQIAASVALAEARRCPRCRRKMALLHQRDEAGVLHRTCRWPDCGHADTPAERPRLLEAVATEATTLVRELATRGRSGRETWTRLRAAVAALEQEAPDDDQR